MSQDTPQGFVEQWIMDTPPANRGNLAVNFDFDKDTAVTFDDDIDGNIFKNKVKKAKPVGAFNGDTETIGDVPFSDKKRPSNYTSTLSRGDQDSLIEHAGGGHMLATRTQQSSKSAFDLQKDIEFLQRQIETFKEHRWKGPSVDDTIRRLLRGQPCALDFYKSKEAKKALLDTALNTLDGNCITKVLLFIKSTSRIGVLVKIVEDKPMAINLFASYLRQSHEYEELIRFYEMVGDKEAAGMLMYERCKSERNPRTQLEKLRHCEIFFRHYPELSPNVPLLQEHMNLLERQLKIHNVASSSTMPALASAGSVLFYSVITTLYYCCRYFYKDTATSSPCNPRVFKTDFKLTEQQYMFMAIKAQASLRDWTEIDDLLSVKGIFGTKLKSPIGFKNVVRFVSNHGAPDEVKLKYLNEVSDVEERLKLAMDYNAHHVAINLLYQAKDQKKLEAYINRVPPGSEYRQVIQDKLRILAIRK